MLHFLRCALALVTLVTSGIASATLTYDYPNNVLFDSSTNLYWSSGPKDVGAWQVATGPQVTSLISEVGSWPINVPSLLGSPEAFSTAVADLVLFFSTDAPSPRPIAGSLPLDHLGNLPPNLFDFPGHCSALFVCYGSFLWYAQPPGEGFDAFGLAYAGSPDVSRNDWTKEGPISTIGNYGRPGFENTPFRLPAGAQFFLVSSINPVPEPEMWVSMLVGLGMLAPVARRKRHSKPSCARVVSPLSDEVLITARLTPHAGPPKMCTSDFAGSPSCGSIA